MPNRPPLTANGSAGASPSRNDGRFFAASLGNRKKEGRLRVAHGGALRKCACSQVLLVFPYRRAALNECVQPLAGVFESHQLVEIDILRSLEGILKIQSLT